FCKLNEKDIVRHSLVQKIVEAYERTENRNRDEKKNEDINKLDSGENDTK
ncbi:MAG: phosphate starvation-inducible protein PhoH, partial [bacterium]